MMLTRAAGLTLLEVLIAISIFALIGLASFRVLTTVTTTQQGGDEYSQRLAMLQKALLVIDRDLQQFVDRGIRAGENQQLPSLMVGNGDYPLELTRGGWQNPLLLPRSALQRVAYDIGPHPQAEQSDSIFFGDERAYLRRLYWPTLDRKADSAPLIQALLPDIDTLQVTVVSDQGRHSEWPQQRSGSRALPQPKALEFAIGGESMGEISRLYKIESFQQ